jgi:hypothetical protein
MYVVVPVDPNGNIPLAIRGFFPMSGLTITMKDVSIGQHKKLDNSIIALKQQLLSVILCCFMHFKWPFLLRLFA